MGLRQVLFTIAVSIPALAQTPSRELPKKDAPKASAPKASAPTPVAPPTATPASTSSTAPESAKPRVRKLPLDPNRALRVEYSLPQWNSDPTAIDFGPVFLRDANTGKIVQFQISETAPDSGQFSGVYNVSFANASEIAPEIYVPTDSKSKKFPGEFQQQIQKGGVQRKPFVINKGERGEQVLQVFETKEAALAALKAVEAGQSKSPAKLPSKIENTARALLDSDKLAKIEAEKKRLADIARASEQTRLGQEAKERLRLEEAKKQQAAMASAEREKRKKMAREYAEAALDLYRSNNYAEAEKNFAKASEFDPENTSYYYKYGITLFRNEKFQEALVKLAVAAGPDVDPTEKKFYQGLCYYRLKENQRAIETFKDVEKVKHPVYSPSAAFYEGMVLFEDLKYEQAKVAFQEVLDTSKDPRLDERAEEMIEKIERLIQLAALKEKQLFLIGTLGLQYDSNILLDPVQQDAGAPTNGGGFRSIFTGSAEWRPVFNSTHELGIMPTLTYLRSFEDKFGAADPIIYGVKVPYKYKGQVSSKAYKLELIPGYEMMYLDEAPVDNKLINHTNTVTFDILNSLIVNDDWMSSANIKVRSEQTKDATVTSADDNPSAVRIGLTWANIFFLNSKKNKAWTGDVGFTTNTAQGKNYRYSRFELNFGYMYPIETWDLQGNAGLNSFYTTYSDRADGRQDTNVTLNAGLTKPWSDSISTTLNGSYVMNNSPKVKTYDYRKYSIGLFLTANTAF